MVIQHLPVCISAGYMYLYLDLRLDSLASELPSHIKHMFSVKLSCPKSKKFTRHSSFKIPFHFALSPLSMEQHPRVTALFFSGQPSAWMEQHPLERALQSLLNIYSSLDPLARNPWDTGKKTCQKKIATARSFIFT